MSVLVLPESENEREQLLEEFEEEAVADVRPSDDRANVPVSVVTERFLRAIVDKVPLDRIEELHLFSPLRQGTVETGIAVVAARVIVADEPEAVVPLELDLNGETSDTPADEAEASADVAGAAELDVELSEEALTADEVELSHEETELASEMVETSAELVETSAELDNDSPYADEPAEPVAEPSAEDSTNAAVEIEHTSSVVHSEPLAEVPHEPRVRHTVYTARYRLIVKGPERGKWEIDVVDEADAPLLTVETVVRGVQRRAGEETATVRYDAGQLARLLRLPLAP